MTLEKVTERVYADTSGNNAGNYGAIVLENEIVFIDAGMYHHITKEEADRIKKKFNRPITKMLLTHYHSDHILGAQGLGPISIVSSSETQSVLSSQFNDPEYQERIQKWAAESKESRPDFWKAVQTISLQLPDIVFENEVTIGINQDVKMWRVGGHTPGSSVIIFEPENIMFCGDLIFNKSFPYAGDEGCDPDQWIAVLKEILDADYSKIVPGHGEVCSDDVIQEHLNFLSNLRESIRDAVQDGLSPEELVDSGRIPDFYVDERSIHRILSTATRWLAFYKSIEEA